MMNAHRHPNLLEQDRLMVTQYGNRGLLPIADKTPDRSTKSHTKLRELSDLA